MPITSDGIPSEKRVKETIEMLSEALRLAIEDVQSRYPDQPKLARALELTKAAEQHIHSGTVVWA